MIDFSSNIGSFGTQGAAIETMIAQLMALERQPIAKLQAARSDLNLRAAMFSDLRSKLTALRSIALELSSTGSTSIFSSKSVTSSNADLVVATAGASAANATYSVEVTALAKAQRVQSNQQASSSQSTGYTGTIRVQNAVIEITSSNNSLEGIRDAINAATYTTGREVVASVVDNRLVVQAKYTGTANKIALADLSGNVLSGLGIVTGPSTNLATGGTASASSSTAGYEASKANDGLYGDANAWKSGTAGSGWIQIDLGTAQTVSRVVWGRDEAGGLNTNVPKDYTIQVSTDGTNWTTVKTVTGHSFASAGENKTDVFAPVTARYVRLDVTATNDGLEPAIDELEIYNDTNMYGSNELQAASDASFKIDGVSVTRGSNTGLSDVIAGLTIDLKGTTTTAVSLSVNPNNSAITAKINGFLSALNDLTSYLKAKTNVEASSQSYTRGQLAGSYTYVSLRRELYNAVSGKVNGTSGGYLYLSEIGITVNSELQFTISDSSTLNNALTNNSAAVAELFNLATEGVANKLLAKLTPFTDTGGRIDDEVEGINNQIENINTRIARLEERLSIREQQLRYQFQAMQDVLNKIVSQQSFLQGLLYNPWSPT